MTKKTRLYKSQVLANSLCGGPDAFRLQVVYPGEKGKRKLFVEQVNSIDEMWRVLKDSGLFVIYDDLKDLNFPVWSALEHYLVERIRKTEGLENEA